MAETVPVKDTVSRDLPARRSTAGSILIRQKGTKIHPGSNVGMGRDYTIYAKIDGVVAFERLGKTRKRVSVYVA